MKLAGVTGSRLLNCLSKCGRLIFVIVILNVCLVLIACSYSCSFHKANTQPFIQGLLNTVCRSGFHRKMPDGKFYFDWRLFSTHKSTKKLSVLPTLFHTTIVWNKAKPVHSFGNVAVCRRSLTLTLKLKV